MNWFIIQGKDHLGPYSTDYMKRMYSEGQIHNESLIWREGFDAPDTYYNLIILKPEEKKFRSLLEMLEPSETTEEQAQVEEMSNLKAEPEIKIEPTVKPTVKPTVTPKKIPASKENKSLMPFLLGTILLVIVFAVPSFFYFNLTTLFSRPSKMGTRDYERLVKAATTEDSKQNFAMAMAKDKSKLWVATNFYHTGKIGINIRSQPGKILGEGIVEATSTGYLEKRFVTFDRFNFLEGSRLTDGYYNVELYSLESLHIPYLKLFENNQKEISYFAEILISSMPASKFEKALKEMNELRLANENNYWEELKQKYETLKAITIQIRDSLVSTFEGPAKWSTKVEKFENDYKLNYGHFFTSFVISNEESYKELANKNFADKVEVIASYTRLSRLAKSVGAYSMEILHDLESFKVTKQKKLLEDLKQNSLNKLDSIIKECDVKLAATEV